MDLAQALVDLYNAVEEHYRKSPTFKVSVSPEIARALARVRELR